MRQQNERPLFATLMYEVLEKLDISIAEYFYLDMIHKLSYQRWCIKSLDHCAHDMRISKRGLIKLRDRLIERDLIQKNLRGHLKVTDKYTGVAVNKVHQTPYAVVNKVPKSVNKVHPIGEQSATKSYNRITLDKRADKLGKGYEAAKAMRERLISKVGLS